MIHEGDSERVVGLIYGQNAEEFKCPFGGSVNIVFGLGEKKFKLFA